MMTLPGYEMQRRDAPAEQQFLDHPHGGFLHREGVAGILIRRQRGVEIHVFDVEVKKQGFAIRQ